MELKEMRKPRLMRHSEKYNIPVRTIEQWESGRCKLPFLSY